MPLYTYECEKCQKQLEHITSIDNRDKIKLECWSCGGRMYRIIDGAPALHGEPYQMKAILADGSRVAGHFGKEAPLLKKKK